jgi:NDP-sugar pyrophosphorylase family protein
MNAMILAAGRGTRLGTIGEQIPKALLEVDDEPLLARHLRYLERHGVSRVVINTHHLADEVEAFVRGCCTSLDVICVREQRLLGTAGAVRNALTHLVPGPFIVLYGDVLFEEPLPALTETHTRNRAVATLAVHESASAEGKGVVDVDKTDRVVRFVEKGEHHSEPVLINSGIYVVEEALIESLPIGIPLDFGHDVLPDAVRGGAPIFVHRLSRAVVDIGTPAALAAVRGRSRGTAGERHS